MRFLFLLLLFPFAARAQGWNDPQSSVFATSLVGGQNGEFWAGAEDAGLFRRDAKGKWSSFAGAKELGDASVTCIATEPNGRVWVGTASAGVSVWNGATWTRFSSAQGPLAPRINDLQVAPDGALWGATDAGVFRWSQTQGWRFPGVFAGDEATRELARRPVYALAFDSQNRVLCATDEGLNRVSLEGDDATIEAVGRAKERLQPPRAFGEGFLPGPLHDVAVDSRGAIWCATRWGVCVGSPDGAKWKFLRGSDWEANARGSAVPLPLDLKAPPMDLLAEDWVTTLAPTLGGQMWLGFREKGAQSRDCASLELIVSTQDDPNMGDKGDFVTSILPLGNDTAAFARYGGGLASLFGVEPPIQKTAPVSPVVAAPEPATFSPDFVRRLARELDGRVEIEKGSGAFYSLDRQTRGDWPLRFGRAGRELFATGDAPVFEPDTRFHWRTAPHLADPTNADLYSYTHWLTSDNPNVLQLPARNIRRQSEFNDGSWQHERYPFAFDGPDLWTRLVVPEGTFRASFYWFNKDGHQGINRLRDHRVELFRAGTAVKAGLTDQPVARARLWSGWNGQYVSFALRGPGTFVARIARDRSHGTILQGVFFDRLGAPLPRPAGLPDRLQTPVAPTFGDDAPFSSAVALWQACDRAETRGALAPLERLVALRAAKLQGAPEPLLASWRVQAGQWDDEGFDRRAVALPGTISLAALGTELLKRTEAPRLEPGEETRRRYRDGDVMHSWDGLPREQQPPWFGPRNVRDKAPEQK